MSHDYLRFYYQNVWGHVVPVIIKVEYITGYYNERVNELGFTVELPYTTSSQNTYYFSRIEKVEQDDLGVLQMFKKIKRTSTLTCPECEAKYSDGTHCRFDGSTLDDKLTFQLKDGDDESNECKSESGNKLPFIK